MGSVANHLLSVCKNHKLSGLKNKCFSITPPIPPYVSVKTIQVQVTCPVDSVPNFVATINANIPQILALLYYVAGASPTTFPSNYSGWSYNFDLFPSFNIANGVLTYPSLFPQDGTVSESSFIHWASFGTSSLTEPGDTIRLPNGALVSGFLTVAGIKAVADSVTKYLQWKFYYDPTLPPGSAYPLYRNDNVRYPNNNVGVVDNVISVPPEADLNTQTVGSVFHIPIPPYDGFYAPGISGVSTTTGFWTTVYPSAFAFGEQTINLAYIGPPDPHTGLYALIPYPPTTYGQGAGGPGGGGLGGAGGAGGSGGPGGAGNS